MDRSFLLDNEQSLVRLRALGGQLDAHRLSAIVRGEWTVSALLAHVAFWDRVTLALWDQYDVSGDWSDVTTKEQEINELVDAVNAAQLGAWLLTPGPAALAEAIAAAEAFNARVRALPPTAVAAAWAANRRYVLDRAWHRDEHLAEIEAVLTADDRPSCSEGRCDRDEVQTSTPLVVAAKCQACETPTFRKLGCGERVSNDSDLG